MTFAAALIRRLRRARTDVLHVQDPQLGLLVQRASRIGLTRTAVIVGHGTNEAANYLRKIRYLQHLSPWQLDRMAASRCISAHLASHPELHRCRSLSSRSCTDVRAELKIPADALVVLSVAAVKRDHKRIDHLLAEFGRLRTEAPGIPAYLIVAGGREADTDDLVRFGRESLGERVRFLVQYPRQRMPELYQAADLFALCSLREMMPIALIEAAASGLPCLVHDHPVLTWIAGGNPVDMSRTGALAAALSEAGRKPTAARRPRRGQP